MGKTNRPVEGDRGREETDSKGDKHSNTHTHTHTHTHTPHTLCGGVGAERERET